MIKLPSLHLNSEYSLLESTIKIDKLINFAKNEGLKELVITDRNNMFGVASFINKCNSNNIKPIIGIDIDVDNFRVVLLAKNHHGYTELMHLSSLKEKGENVVINQIISDNLFIIDHPKEGYFVKNNAHINSKNFFIGSNSDEVNSVIFNETKILKVEENEALELLNSIKGGDNKKYNFKPLSINTQDLNQSAIKNTKMIIENCNIIFPSKIKILPEYPISSGMEKISFLNELLNKTFDEKILNTEEKAVYRERLSYEIDIISQLGFVDYFLIIWDLVKWSKENKIAVGPGRGSAAGSLTSYLLGITEIDPIKFGLLFERFLNPERVSMPDIDIDIQDSRREEVIKYIFNKYGKENVGLISTFSKIGAKTALRDVARYMGLPLRDVDALSKMVSLNASLQETYNSKVRFRALIEKSTEFTNLFNKALLIEGLPRQKGTHAAGIVISDSNLEKKVPITLSAEGYNQSQYSMSHLETHGLLKIDLLGLRNLSIIQDIQSEIFKSYGKKVNLNKIELNDKQTNELLTSGNTNGIFQLESYGMKKTLIEVGVDSFDDLVSIISLYRPGPMEFIGEYANVKKNISMLNSVHPIYDKIVKPTNGIIVYQEQIMQIAQSVSNMSFGSADILRRAISKKNLETIEKLKEMFISGALTNGLSETKANIIYKNIEKFANYGFNKSHAVSYGMIAYWLAFLKARFPLEFYTAALKNSSSSLKQVEKYIKEAKKINIEIISPNVNYSKSFVYSQDKKIILPLTIIKGLGENVNKKITNALETYDKFDDFVDFVVKAKAVGIGDGQLALLINGGALKDFGNIKTLLESLPLVIRYADMTTEKVNDNIEIYGIKLPKPILSAIDYDPVFEMQQEKKSFGFNIDVYPTSKYEKDIKISSLKVNQPQEIYALIESVKEISDKNNNPMWIMNLSDSSGNIEVFVFSNIINKVKLYKKGSIIKITIVKKEFKNKFNYNALKSWEIIDE